MIEKANKTMSSFMVLVVLCAALMHASWSILVKLGGNARTTTTAFMAGSAFIAMLGLPFISFPSLASLPFMFISVFVQIIYMYFIGIIYQKGDISQSYPIMRGMPPLLIALCSGFIIGEILSLKAWIGIALISIGILALAFEALRKSGQIHATVLPLTLLNAALIACYTMLDAVGIRLSQSPIGYILWIFFLIGLPRFIFAIAMPTTRSIFMTYIKHRWWLVLIGGMLSLGAYGLALWAMTSLPVAIVSALRETSIVFAIILSFIILKEKISCARMIAALLIVCGVIAVRLA